MRSRLSLVQQIISILVVILMIVFFTGYSMMYSIGEAHLDHIYSQTQALMSAAITRVEAELTSGAQSILYDIIVSDTVQEAGSNYLRRIAEGNRTASRTSLDVIGNHIQQQILSSPLILCANLLEEEGSVRVIASRGYRRMEADLVAQVDSLARNANGSPVYIPAGDQMLILARQLRERRNLSMKHIAVVALYLDLSQIGKTLVQHQNGLYVLEHAGTGYSVVFGQDGAALPVQEGLRSIVMDEKGYALESLNGELFFITRFEGPRQMFTYTVLLPYDDAFAQIQASFRHYTQIYVICFLIIILLATTLTRYATRDFSRLMNHIRSFSDSAFKDYGQHQPLHLTSKDSSALYAAFNTMAQQVNELIYDNYQKQLLLKETHLASLQAQINPHFLYNTLNSIYWMAKQSGDNRIAEMTDSLSRLLREAVNISEPLIDIDRELEIIFHYVRIQHQRYAERMRLSFDVAEDCNNLVIPKFTIQPLLGNAINYGVGKMLEPCAISIRIYREGEDCVCQVRNQGPPPEENLMEKLRRGEMAAQGTGVGLLNIDQRIRSVFGEKYGVTVFRDEQMKETVAQARFKAMTADEMEVGQRE